MDDDKVEQNGSGVQPESPGGASVRQDEQEKRMAVKTLEAMFLKKKAAGGEQQQNGRTDHTASDHNQDQKAAGQEKSHEGGDASKTLNSVTADGSGSGMAETNMDGVKADNNTPPSSARWGALRQRLRESTARKGKGYAERNKARIAGQMSVVTELQTGILPVFMLKMAMERDEQDHRRIPVLLSHLRFRISDSVNPLHTSSAIFRIELEYGDGLIRWVCYRSLRDFINLHTHYRAAAIKGYLGRSVGAAEGDVGLPSFPKTSLPYFNQLQRQGWGKQGDNPKARFAQIQRTSLEDYLLEIIKRTMLRPEANRLCKFFELSSLSLSLAARGGYQGKQGYLRILSRSSRKDAQRKGILRPLQWTRMQQPKWFIVRESYIVAVEQPDSTEIYDVILIDKEFEVIRPKRLYKQTLNLAHDIRDSDKSSKSNNNDKERGEKGEGVAAKDNRTSGAASSSSAAKGVDGEQKQQQQHSHATRGKDETAILTEGQFRDEGEDEYSGTLRRKNDSNTSRHTFYVKNAERKLKFVANNERQMNQFIASMERVARRNIFSKTNRFDSFAPIRLNCHAQWLVDGRDYFWQVSRALMRAKSTIYIHDWWLSPELYLRRPGVPKYRLDNILKSRAEDGVKIFVILYNEVSNNFTPTDSNYSKQRLISLHKNIFVQRSPSHFQTGTFYWAHHEKLCVIDETIAFMGGLDLCFGRWDTSSHVLTDRNASLELPRGSAEAHDSTPLTSRLGDANISSTDQHHAKTASLTHGGKRSSTFIGPSINGSEFYVWPGQDYANERVMEWHDLTKPEIDLFDRKHYPRMPWHDVGLQIIGQPARDLCRHFTQRWNHLLRIKSHSRQMPFIVPPPDFLAADLEKYGFKGTCEAQICRSAGPWSMGTPSTVEHSIQNAYLKAIQLSEHFVYIENQFFVTSTEARGTVVENRIGEALVSRIIRAHRQQTAWKAVIVIPLIPGFPMPIDHPEASSVRLIVDLQYRSICRGEESVFGRLRRRGIDPADYIDFYSLRQWGKLSSGRLTTEQVYIHGKTMVVDDRLALIGSANINERSQRGDRDSELACVIRDTDMIDSRMAGKPFKVGRFAHTLRVRLMREHLGIDVDTIEEEEEAGDPHEKQNGTSSPLSTDGEKKQEGSSTEETINRMHTAASSSSDNPWAPPAHAPKIDASMFTDPLDDKFYRQMWMASAVHNTQIFRKVFKSMPDDMVTTWQEYKAFHAWNDRLSRSGGHTNERPPPPPAPMPDKPKHSRKLRHKKTVSAASSDMATMDGQAEEIDGDDDDDVEEGRSDEHDSDNENDKGDGDGAPGVTANPSVEHAKANADMIPRPMTGATAIRSSQQIFPQGLSNNYGPQAASGSTNNTLSKHAAQTAVAGSIDEGFSQKELDQMEALLKETRGTLVMFSTKFLEAEDRSDNFLFPMDKINPLK